MKFDEIARVVDGIPWMTLPQAQRMTALLEQEKPKSVLELGCKHGVSTCYIAGALQENGGGHVTTIDLKSAEKLSPNVEQLLGKLGLRDGATVHYEDTSYTWRMMEMLERSPRPQFDFCYLDGAHNWDTDGFAFFLVDKLLAEGGMLILDDIEWSYAKSPTLQDEAWVQSMPRNQYHMEQVRKVFDILVCEHPNYGHFKIENGWGIAQKLRSSDNSSAARYIKETVVHREEVGLGALMLKVARRVSKQTGRRISR